MAEPTVIVSKRAGYRILTLNRPDRLNAFNETMHDELRLAIEDAERDETCRSLLLTGAGRGFCAGQDLSDRLARPGEQVVLGGTLEAHYNPLVRKLRALPIPVVCAVNGVAAGAGCNLALACDIVIAAHSAAFVQSFARVGLVPDSGGTWILPRLIGMARARGLALLAEGLPADKAEHWGLIWKAVADGALMNEAEKICQQFANAPTYGLSLIKRALDTAMTNSLDQQLDLERDFQRMASLSPDYTEGVRAFMEKRKPNFTGAKGKLE
ncbi:MAG: 2-(1,2-epoxy-1,2-dihydrophenyl)acetyl-CoA isomerase [Pseudolabrys sp.]|nr:2-(1,2-epoxy-1,2-dihydrophenyl)acetyl-CoA isomerase [Pseudolabrys sp.]